MNISIAVAVRDETEEHRKKQGDIIAIKPEGWQWGTGEVKNHLILEIALPPQATMDRCMALMTRYYDNGIIGIDETGTGVVIGKRRFKLDWNKLKTVISQAGIPVDWNQVEDVDVAYQPLSSQDVVPGGVNVYLDPTKVVFDKYENRLIKAVDFSQWIIV